eukprot:TRINITY_DN10272_c0_g1_i1.p2 TRINITY_DN10272_c0_g1~~TRINITY_DN10272_c0_g1_i1.p2  ORF type:complete len:60 (+),score=9.75 TRINITY_DN10272_c0_g1_i1:315-494(+)
MQRCNSRNLIAVFGVHWLKNIELFEEKPEQRLDENPEEMVAYNIQASRLRGTPGGSKET